MMENIKTVLSVLPLLALSAALESGGDAGIRSGLHGKQIGYFIGAALLVIYGLVVNIPKWDFGKLMGAYIAVFFVVSQIIALVIFHEKIKPPLVVGGALIVAGGLVLTLWQPK